MIPTDLRAAVDKVLIEHLHAGLRAALAEGLAMGATPQRLLHAVRLACVRNGAGPYSGTALAAWAYLEHQTGQSLE